MQPADGCLSHLGTFLRRAEIALQNQVHTGEWIMKATFCRVHPPPWAHHAIDG